MRRNSLLVLMSMIVLLIVIGVLLFSIFLRSSTSSDTVATGTVTPATLPAPPEQQMAPLSEPIGTPMRLVYIVSILVVFVSAVLVLFRMLFGISGKDQE